MRGDTQKEPACPYLAQVRGAFMGLGMECGLAAA